MPEDVVAALELSLLVASVSTVLMAPPAIALAYLMARRAFPGRDLLAALLGLPLVLPPTAIGLLLLRLFGSGGLLGRDTLGIDLGFLLTWRGAVAACAVMALPLVVRTARVTFEGIDPRFEAMARTLGHGPIAAFTRFTLPLAARGLLAAAILGFTRAVGEFGATVMVAGNIPGRTRTLASGIYAAQQAGREREATVLVLVAIAVGMVAIFASERLARSPFVDGRGQRRAAPATRGEGGTDPGTARLMLRLDVRLALSSFALEVAVDAARRVTGIFGPSGAGKTSLLEAVIGLRRDARGSIEIDGVPWLDTGRGIFVPIEERGIGYVPQEGLLFPHLDVRDNLLAGAPSRARRLSRGGAEIARVCALLEIDALLDRPVSTLSAGQRQRVALARGVCSRPRLLVLDEPLASLDLPLRRRILPFLRRLRDELDLPMLYVSHQPLEIQALCDEVIVLREGRVVAQGAPARVLADAEVFALAPGEDYENVLVARAGAPEDGEGRAVELAPGVELRVPPFSGAAGSTVLVSIPAQQVLLAVEAPRRLSAQNVLRGVVRDVRPAGALRLVAGELGSGGPELVAEVTPRACVDLELRAGREVFMIVKQTGCRVYSSGNAD